MTRPMRADPLAYLADELDELRAKNLYRPLRVMTGPQAVAHGRRRRAGHQPVVEQLPRPDHPSRSSSRRPRKAVRELGVGTGAVRTIAGATELHRGAGAPAGRLQARRGGADAPVRASPPTAASSRRSPTDARPDRQRRAQPRLDHRRRAAVQGVARRLPAPRRRRPREGAARGARQGRRRTGRTARILVITDGVFSMDGDIAPLAGICDVAERYEAAVMVDDAHASGVLGRNGRGTVDHFDLHGRVDIQVGTLSKAVGVMGGYIAGRQHLQGLPDPALPARCSSRRRSRRPSPPPASPPSTCSRTSPSGSSGCGTTRASSRAGLQELGFDTGISRDADHAGHGRRRGTRRQKLAARLFERGVFATSVVFPTVAAGQGARAHDRHQRAHARRPPDLPRCVRDGGARAAAHLARTWRTASGSASTSGRP